MAPLLLITSQFAQTYAADSQDSAQPQQERRLSSWGQSDYRLENYRLARQLTGDSRNRVFPSTDHLSFASDSQFFFSQTQKDDVQYYHSGHWTNAYTEVRPVPEIALNLRTAIYNPGTSYGYAASARFHPFFGATVAQSDVLPWKIQYQLRMVDLDRQTLAAGLTLDRKEMSGFAAELRRGDARLKWIQAGTGGYNYDGDLQVVQLDLFDDLIGLATFNLGRNILAPFNSIYSYVPITETFRARAELSTRLGHPAGLVSLKYQDQWANWLRFRIEPTLRSYATGYANQIARQIEQDYVTIEVMDRPYADSLNLFAVRDGVTAPSLELSALAFPERRVRIFADAELVQAYYRQIPKQSFAFYKGGVSLCPINDRDDCASLFVTNKYLDRAQEAYASDRTNRSLFTQKFYAGSEFKLRF